MHFFGTRIVGIKAESGERFDMWVYTCFTVTLMERISEAQITEEPIVVAFVVETDEGGSFGTVLRVTAARRQS